ncbi:uncharacterized protein LOC120844553 [Ixodes scapularis]|uniref:uncharacterized protein LOC120844553 n=1 Tax=Ixodes scapularis TaxID=6945 RepID=UPI001A9D78DD|nr:uncharacterized protein LOC120844553 [Ixodes scapularis]
MAQTEKTFEAGRDRVIAKQFLSCCHPKLAIFLKERNVNAAQEMAELADQYLEAQGKCNLGAMKDGGCTTVSPDDENSKGTGQTGGTRRPSPRCFLCSKVGHKATDCRSGYRQNQAEVRCWECGKMGHKAGQCANHSQNKAACVLDKRQKALKRYNKEQQGAITNTRFEHVTDADLVHNIDIMMPVVEGRLHDIKISVLRDSGTNTVLVRKGLVRSEEFTGTSTGVILVDGTMRDMPEAIINIDTPYYTGEVRAKCVEEPLYDLILGNIPGARKVDCPDAGWGTSTKKIRHQGDEVFGETQSNSLNSVTSHAENDRVLQEIGEKEELNAEQIHNEVSFAAGAKRTDKREEKQLPQLKAPVIELLEVTALQLTGQQKSDESLQRCFRSLNKRVRKWRCDVTTEYVVKDDLLFRRLEFSDGDVRHQLIVPTVFRKTVMELAHDGIMSGHQGVKSTVARVAEEFFWPGMQGDVKRYIRSCDVCQRTIPKGTVKKAPMMSMPIIEEPFHRVAIDIIGPITPKSSKGNRYILTMVDVATRYPDAVALKTIDTPQVAEALVEMFSRYGVPKEILSDRGTNFTSNLMKEIGRLLSFRQLLTTPYHPMCNRLVERFNGTIKQMMKRMSQERPTDWDRYIPALLFAYRGVPQASLGFAPFEMLYGRNVRGPLTILKELWSNKSLNQELKTSYGYVIELKDKLKKTCEVAHEIMAEAQTKQKRFYDRKSQARRFEPGDRVLILLPSDHNKLTMQWKGPYEVARQKGDLNYELLVGDKRKTFHINMLQKYVGRETKNESCGVMVVQDEVEDLGEITTPSLKRQQGAQDVVINPKLSQKQKKDLADAIGEFEDIFSDVPGRTNALQCKLRLMTEEPVFVRQYPLPFAIQDEVEEEVEEMLRLGIIERSTSAYNAPIIMDLSTKQVLYIVMQKLKVILWNIVFRKVA